MKCPWSVPEEMEEYAKKHGYVSSACRLTTEEEMLLLQLCSPDSRGRLSLTLLNRKAFVTAVSSLSTLPKDKTLTVKLGTERPPVFENFDIGPDNTIIDNPKKTLISSKLFGAAYTRPEEVSKCRVLEANYCSIHCDPYSQRTLLCPGSNCIRWAEGLGVCEQRGNFRG